MQEDERIDPRNLTFSQAQGYEDLPGPLALEELGSDARRRLWDLLYLNVEGASPSVGGITYGIRGDWAVVVIDLQREFLKRTVEQLTTSRSDFLSSYRRGILNDFEFNKVFDLLQFIMRHPSCPGEFTPAVKFIFEDCQLAYFVDTNEPPTIFPMSTRHSTLYTQAA